MAERFFFVAKFHSTTGELH